MEIPIVGESSLMERLDEVENALVALIRKSHELDTKIMLFNLIMDELTKDDSDLMERVQARMEAAMEAVKNEENLDLGDKK